MIFGGLFAILELFIKITEDFLPPKISRKKGAKTIVSRFVFE